MKKASPKRSNAPARRGQKTSPRDMHQATSAEFEREDMGIAPKE